MYNDHFENVLDLYSTILYDNDITGAHLNVLINLDDKECSIEDIMRMPKEDRENSPLVEVTIQFGNGGWGTIGWDDMYVLDEDGEPTEEEANIFEYQSAQDAANLIFARAMENHYGWLAESLLKSNIDWKIK